VLLLTGASVGAVVEKLISNKSDSELLLVTLDDDVFDDDGAVPCVVLRRDDIPLDGGGATSCVLKKIEISITPKFHKYHPSGQNRQKTVGKSAFLLIWH